MSKKSILIVTDDCSAVENLRIMLEHLDYAIAGVAERSEEAISMASSLRPNLILMDIHLPGGSDGMETANAILKSKNIPTVFLTDHSDTHILTRQEITGHSGYVLKPIEERDLAVQIELALCRHDTDLHLQQQREWFHAILNNIDEAVIAVDVEGRIILMNPAGEKLTGWRFEDAKGLPLTRMHQVVDDQTGQPLENPVHRILLEGRPVPGAHHSSIITRDGRKVSIEDSLALIKDVGGQPIGVAVVCRGVTAKRCEEEMWLECEEKFKMAFHVSPCPMIISSLKDSRYIEANAAFETVLGYSRKELENGMTFLEIGIWPSQEDRQVLVDKLLSEGGIDNLEISLKSRDGDLRTGLLSARAITLREEKLILAAWLDVTEHKAIEKKLREFTIELENKVAERTALAEARTLQLQALAVELIDAEERERERIAQILHDDLQQVLAAARMHLDVVIRSLPGTEILTSVEKMLLMSIEKARRLSHEMSPPAIHHTNLGASLKWLTTRLEEQFGLIVDVGSDQSPVLYNRFLKIFVIRAVQELLFNVVKHAGVDRAEVRMTSVEDNLVLTVSDQGRGFDAEVLDSVEFNAGFGLLSLRERAHYFGGSLTIESAPGKGSSLTLTVPMSIAKQPDSEQASELGERSTKTIASEGIRVLFVDDHKVMRKGLINLIGAQPDIHVVGEASDGQEAISRILQDRPDVVLMDVSMPGMNGVEATRQIKAEFPEIRVIGLSMHTDETVRSAMLEAGAETFLNKTSSAAELLDMIYGSDVAP